MKLLVTLERDETEMIVAECPAIPGCISQGLTEKEALDNVDLGGICGRNLADRFFERDHFLFAHVLAQYSRECAVVARVRISSSKRAFLGDRCAVRANGSKWLAQRVLHIFLGVMEVN